MGKKLSIIAWTVFTLTLSLEPAFAQSGDSRAYHVGGGDVLEINVWKNTDLSRTVTVRPDGMISLPLIYDIRAGGKTVEELRATITEALTKADLVNLPNVTVTVVAATSYRVYAIGAVTTSGMFPLSEPMTALQLLARAGGAGIDADLVNAFVMRGSIQVPVQLDPVLLKESRNSQPLLLPGDVLVVPTLEALREEPSHRILITGEVRTPQPLPFREGMTVLDAFVQAGGGTDFAKTDSVKVIRKGASGKDTTITVKLNKVMKHGDLDQNIALAPGDIVVVP